MVTFVCQQVLATAGVMLLLMVLLQFVNEESMTQLMTMACEHIVIYTKLQ